MTPKFYKVMQLIKMQFWEEKSIMSMSEHTMTLTIQDSNKRYSRSFEHKFRLLNNTVYFVKSTFVKSTFRLDFLV